MILQDGMITRSRIKFIQLALLKLLCLNNAVKHHARRRLAEGLIGRMDSQERKTQRSRKIILPSNYSAISSVYRATAPNSKSAEMTARRRKNDSQAEDHRAAKINFCPQIILTV